MALAKRRTRGKGKRCATLSGGNIRRSLSVLLSRSTWSRISQRNCARCQCGSTLFGAMLVGQLA
eukprot:65271-Rhodomonas_salina.1